MSQFDRCKRWLDTVLLSVFPLLVIFTYNNHNYVLFVDAYAFTNRIISKSRTCGCKIQRMYHRLDVIDRQECRLSRRSGAVLLSMRDRSSSDVFDIGASVKVTKSVLKGGIDLKGKVGKVIENWTKCEVDPTCCCAEQVDLGMAVLVEFDGSVDGGSFIPKGEIFTHYFGEDELDPVRIEEAQLFQSNSVPSDQQIPFDGLSCKAFKLERIKMGQQARRLASFEGDNRNRNEDSI